MTRCDVCGRDEPTTVVPIPAEGVNLQCCKSCAAEVKAQYCGKWYVAVWQDGTLMFAGTRVDCEAFAATYKKADQKLIKILEGGK